VGRERPGMLLVSNLQDSQYVREVYGSLAHLGERFAQVRQEALMDAKSLLTRSSGLPSGRKAIRQQWAADPAPFLGLGPRPPLSPTRRTREFARPSARGEMECDWSTRTAAAVGYGRLLKYRQFRSQESHRRSHPFPSAQSRWARCNRVGRGADWIRLDAGVR
jgi:hypothetical protein